MSFLSSPLFLNLAPPLMTLFWLSAVLAESPGFLSRITGLCVVVAWFVPVFEVRSAVVGLSMLKETPLYVYQEEIDVLNVSVRTEITS